MSIKFLVSGGGGIRFWWGGGKCRFYFYGRGDFSDYCLFPSLLMPQHDVMGPRRVIIV